MQRQRAKRLSHGMNRDRQQTIYWLLGSSRNDRVVRIRRMCASNLLTGEISRGLEELEECSRVIINNNAILRQLAEQSF